MRRSTIHTILALIMVACASAQAPVYKPLPAKKLLEYGWDVPQPEQLATAIRQMETRPFDGVIFRLRDYNHAFDTTPWPVAAIESQVVQLEAIDWRRFSDNFLTLYAANRDTMDWFDDTDWRVIEGNLRRTAEAARRGGCVGIMFDPEPYGPNPWLLSDAAPGREFPEVAAQVRRRGAQFINALQQEMPAIRLLSLYQLSVVAAMFETEDPARIDAQLARHHYGLLPAFLDGILDAIGPDAVLIDGNEPAYYYEDEAPFAEAYVSLAQRAARLVSPENRPTYRRQSQVGMAIYVDQVLGLRRPPQGFVAHFMTPQQRLAFLEHNVYWSLATADEYAWIYSERIDWWTGEFPQGAADAVAAARSKVTSGASLGFDLDTLVWAAKQQMEAELVARVEQRSAVIRRRDPSTPVPAIDGMLDEPVWTSSTELASFQVPAARSDTLQAPTRVRVLWDDQGVYLGIRCIEPTPARIVRQGQHRDDPIWAGDDIEVFVGSGEGAGDLHFIVNPDNLQWDGRSGGQGDDSIWDGQWQSAVTETAEGWTVEIALPWATLGGEIGGQRRVNLCRARAGGEELSCWSGTLRLFVEPGRLGHWTFAH